MLNLDEINGEIARLESKPLTYVTIERLSWLYIVRDHIMLTSEPMAKTHIDKTVPGGDSEFCKACAGKSIDSVMGVMDEAMSTIQLVQPKLYGAIMELLN